MRSLGARRRRLEATDRARACRLGGSRRSAGPRSRPFPASRIVIARPASWPSLPMQSPVPPSPTQA